MPLAGFSAAAWDFYAGLVADNSRAYWSAHQKGYEEAVRRPMQQLLAALGAEFGGQPSVFRPYRDSRFSADKSPYKTHQGGFLEVAPGVGYHLQVDAAGLLVSGGFHAHSAAQTARYRAAVTDPQRGEQLAAITSALTGHGFTIGGDQVGTRPRGVAADHPRLDLVRRKWLVAERRHAPAGVAGPGAVDVVRADWTALRPLVCWAAAHCPPAAA